MKFKCKRNLYWVQQSGFTGYLQPQQSKILEEESILEFIKDKEYEIIPLPTKDALENIFLVAVGESGKKYVVLKDSLHVSTTKFVLSCFDFSKVGEITGHCFYSPFD